MIAALLAMAVVVTPRVFVSVDHPFVPDRPGSVVRVELEGSHTLDVRLYELHDPERFLSAGDGAEAVLAAQHATPSASLGAKPATTLREQQRARLVPLLSDAAQSAVHLLVPGSALEAPSDPPFLHGERLLRRWTLPCGGTQSHSYCDVDLGPLPAGVYLVEGFSGGQAAYAVALSTNLVLTARRLPTQLLLSTADAQTGAPRPNVQVDVSALSQSVLHGTTGPQGTLVLKPTAKHLSAIAHLGSDWAQLDLDYFSRRGHGSRVWLSTDRGEARPGEVIRFVGVEHPPPTAAREIPVALEDGRGTTVATALAREDERGLFTGFFEVPAGVVEGLGHVVAELGGREESGEVLLHDPSLPELGVEVAFDGFSRARVKVTSASGSAIQARCEWHLLRTPLQRSSPLAPTDEPPPTEVVASGEVATDAEGLAAILLPPPADGDARLRVEVSAVDAWGRRAFSQVERTRLTALVHVDLETERRLYSPGDTAHWAVVTSDANGHPSPATLSIRAAVSRIGPSGEPQSTALPAQAVIVPASGRGELILANLEPGYYELDARAGTVHLADGVFFVTAKGGDIPYTPDALTLVPDRPRYQVGDTARVLVLAPFESASTLFTAESGELLKEDTLAIHGSSALAQVKIPAAGGITFAASAIFAGQAYAGAQAVAIGPAMSALQIDAAIEPGRLPGLADLVVRARDGAGKPAAAVEVVATWRDAEAERSLAPGLLDFLEPPPAREGRTDVSLDFHRAGYSHGTAAARLEHLRTDLTPLEGFTPQKGQAATPPRAFHSTTGGLERLPLTDRAGVTRLTLPLLNAEAIHVDLIALSAPDAAKSLAVAEAHARFDAPGPYVSPTLPTVLRAEDQARAEIDLHGPPGAVLLNGVSTSIPSVGTGHATVPLDAKLSKLEASTLTGRFLEQQVPVASDPRERVEAIAEVTAGHPVRLSVPGQVGPWRLRLATGASGLLALADDAPARTESGDLEHHGDPGRWQSADEALAALARSLAANADLPILAPRTASLIRWLAPDGSLARSPVEEPDVTRTALALLLLDEAHDRGVGVPPEWFDRVQARVQSITALPGPARALGLWALGEEASTNALTERIETDASGRLSPLESAALALALAARHVPEAKEVAVRLEHRAAISAGRACWKPDGCDPDDPPTWDSVAATALSAVALVKLRPRSPRLPEALRYLLAARALPAWRTGIAGALVPRALAELSDLLPEGPATVTLNGEAASSIAVPSEAVVERTVDALPVLLRANGARVFVEVIGTAAAPDTPPSALQIERRWWLIDDDAETPTRNPLEKGVSRGDEVWVELTIRGAARGAAVHVEDPFPGGLVPSEQPETQGPLARLKETGGQIAFAPDRVIIDAKAEAGPLVVGYLARAITVGHYHSPPARAAVGEAQAQSSANELEIEEEP